MYGGLVGEVVEERVRKRLTGKVREKVMVM